MRCNISVLVNTKLRVLPQIVILLFTGRFGRRGKQLRDFRNMFIVRGNSAYH